MKTRYLLFLTSCLCGLALAFAYFYGHEDGDVHGVTSESKSTHILSDEQALSIATRLVGDRDAALIAHNHDALQALTVPGSPARTIDDALFDSMDSISVLNTIVLDVRVLTDNEWEVHSVQQEISMGNGSSGEGQARCTLWHLSKNPWRLYETSDCG